MIDIEIALHMNSTPVRCGVSQTLFCCWPPLPGRKRNTKKNLEKLRSDLERCGYLIMHLTPATLITHQPEGSVGPFNPGVR